MSRNARAGKAAEPPPRVANLFEDVTLEDARGLARIGAWYLILGVPASATAAQITKARRKMQMKHHEDKCGNHEMSALVNRAADEMLDRHPDVIRQRAETRAHQDAKSASVAAKLRVA